jgi:hypothetical protein
LAALVTPSVAYEARTDIQRRARLAASQIGFSVREIWESLGLDLVEIGPIPFRA